MRTALEGNPRSIQSSLQLDRLFHLQDSGEHLLKIYPTAQQLLQSWIIISLTAALLTDLSGIRIAPGVHRCLFLSDPGQKIIHGFLKATGSAEIFLRDMGQVSDKTADLTVHRLDKAIIPIDDAVLVIQLYCTDLNDLAPAIFQISSNFLIHLTKLQVNENLNHLYFPPFCDIFSTYGSIIAYSEKKDKKT